MSENIESRRSGGSYRERLVCTEDIEICDLENPWNFFYLFLSSDSTINSWCRANRLLASTIKCRSKVKTGQNDDGTAIYEECGGDMFVKERAGKPGSSTFRCINNRNHEKGIRAYSFFEKAHITIPDIMLFIKSYLDKLTLRQCSIFSGISYRSTAVNWGCFMRELFKDHFQKNITNRKISGEIEIDESLFGRRIKFHRGNPRPGLRIWIFGMVERQSNTVILYPVCNRTKETLLPLIQRHVSPGSTIFSDGWSAYCDLNSLGFDHFTVLHKYSFKKMYVNQETKEKVVCHTNEIEGAWKHAKDYFRKMAGTQLSQFEGHLAEIMWRSEAKGRLYQAFFDLLRSVYTLEGPPEYAYGTPLFDSWNLEPSSDTPLSAWTIMPVQSDAESEVSSQSEAEAEPVVVSSDDSFIPPNKPMTQQSRSSKMSGTLSEAQLSALFSSTSLSGEDDPDSTLIQEPSTPGTEIPGPSTDITTGATGYAEPGSSTQLVRKKTKSSKAMACTESSASGSGSISKSAASSGKPKRTKTDNVCHPPGYKQEKEDRGRRRQRKKSNPYSKSAFKYTFSSDDEDFA